jgi:hypothetical protein
MPDIFTESTLIQRRWKKRAKKIVITNPSSEMASDNKKEIIFDVEEVPYDNNMPKFDETKSLPPLKVGFSDVITETFTIFDPITRKNVTISIAGIASAIEEAYFTWQTKK